MGQAHMHKCPALVPTCDGSDSNNANVHNKKVEKLNAKQLSLTWASAAIAAP
jgi:hypothetical protein